MAKLKVEWSESEKDALEAHVAAVAAETANRLRSGAFMVKCFRDAALGNVSSTSKFLPGGAVEMSLGGACDYNYESSVEGAGDGDGAAGV